MGHKCAHRRADKVLFRHHPRHLARAELVHDNPDLQCCKARSLYCCEFEQREEGGYHATNKTNKKARKHWKRDHVFGHYYSTQTDPFFSPSFSLSLSLFLHIITTPPLNREVMSCSMPWQVCRSSSHRARTTGSRCGSRLTEANSSRPHASTSLPCPSFCKYFGHGILWGGSCVKGCCVGMHMHVVEDKGRSVGLGQRKLVLFEEGENITTTHPKCNRH